MGFIGEFLGNLKEMDKNLRWFMWCVFLNGVIVSSTSVLLSIYYKELGMTEGTIGALLSLRTIGVSAGAFLSIILARSIGTKKSLFLSFGLMMFSGFAFVNIIWMPFMQVTSLTFGIGQGIYNVIQSPMLRKYSTDESVVGNFSASFVISNVAMFIGNSFFGVFSDAIASIGGETFGRIAVLNFSFLLLGGSIFALQRIDFGAEVEVVSGSKKFTLKEMSSILTPASRLYMVQVALVGAGAGLICPFFSVYIKESLQVSDSVVGLIMGISQIGTITGGLCVPFLVRRFGRVGTIIACQLLSIPFLISISFPQGLLLMTLGFFFRSGFMNMANPVLESLAMDMVAEKHRTTMSSIFMLINHMFRAIGTSAGGLIMQNISYNMPYYFTIALYMSATLVIYLLFGRKEKSIANTVK